MRMHMAAPNTKLRRTTGIMVKGMQKTASSRSETARFSKKTLVTVLIFLFWISVIITSTLPTTDSRKISTYTGI